jgi:glycosyltransferase involved in cell wall biosynthesis
MKIAINGLSARFGGGLAYLKNLLKHLAKIDKENEYIVFSNPERRKIFGVDSENFEIVVPPFPGKAIARRALWEQIILPILIKRYKVDVLFSPGGINPLIIPGDCRLVNMAQNMAPFHKQLLASYPFSLRKMRFSILRGLYPFFVRRANVNIFISEYARRTFIKITNFNIENSAVIYHGRDVMFKPVQYDTAIRFIQELYGIDGGFILYISNIARYKKQLEVVQAYGIMRSHGAKVNRLIMAGIMVEPSYYHEVTKLARNLGVSDEVIYLGQIPQDHLPYLYSAASVFVFASIAENCPNILIEAMGCGVPIVCSSSEPMPEICKGAALYFDPNKPDDIAEKMRKVLDDDRIRNGIVENALREAGNFSWKNTAQKTLDMLSIAYKQK